MGGERRGHPVGAAFVLVATGFCAFVGGGLGLLGLTASDWGDVDAVAVLWVTALLVLVGLWSAWRLSTGYWSLRQGCQHLSAGLILSFTVVLAGMVGLIGMWLAALARSTTLEDLPWAFPTVAAVVVLLLLGGGWWAWRMGRADPGHRPLAASPPPPPPVVEPPSPPAP